MEKRFARIGIHTQRAFPSSPVLLGIGKNSNGGNCSAGILLSAVQAS